MKNKLNYLFSLLLVGFVTNIFAQSPQLQSWAIPQHNQVNFSIPAVNINPLPMGAGSFGYGAFVGGYGNVAHNTMTDENGNLLFFIAENFVYDKDGDLIGPLTTDPAFVNTGNIYLSPEIAIIPDNANCNKFHIVTGFKSDPNFTADFKTYYAVLDLTLQNPNYPTNPLKKGKLQTNSINGTLFPFPVTLGGTYDIHSVSVHIAVSKLRTVGGTPHRFIFIADAQNIYRFKLDASGITYDASSTPINTNSGNSSWLRGEMELIEDVPHNNYKIAVVALQATGGYKIFTANIIYTTGALTSSSDINLPNPASGPLPIPHGIEFSPNGKYLYIAHETSSSMPGGNIHYYDFGSLALSPLAITSPAAYQFSQIELGYQLSTTGLGVVQPMYFESATGLAALKDANTPGSGINYISFTNSSTFLPDQIDGEIYYGAIPIIYAYPNPICAGSTSTLCAVNYTAGSGTTISWGKGSSTSCIVVSPTINTVFTLVVTPSVGCIVSSNITLTVNPSPVISADFYFGNMSINSTDYTISAVPYAITSYPTSSFWWEICEVDVATGLIGVASTTMTNAQTWWYSPFITNNTFPGYDYHYTNCVAWPPTSPIYTPPYTTSIPSPGIFQIGHAYRVTRATWGDCTPWTTVSKYIYQSPPVHRNSNPNVSDVIIKEVDYHPEMPKNLMMATNVQATMQEKQQEIIISPNPNNGVFTLSVDSGLVKNIYVYDVSGKIVYENTGVTESTIEININNQPNGIYVVRVTDINSSATQKIIKQ